MKFKPNGSWVVLPDPTITETNVLKGLAIGPQCTFVKTGDIVMVDPRTEAVKSVIEDKDYLIVGEHQLLGKW